MKFWPNKSISIEEKPDPEDLISFNSADQKAGRQPASGKKNILLIATGFVVLSVILWASFQTIEEAGIPDQVASFHSGHVSVLGSQQVEPDQEMVFADWIRSFFPHVPSWDPVEFELASMGWTDDMIPESVIAFFDSTHQEFPVGLQASLASGENIWIFPYHPEVRLEWQEIDVEVLPFSQQVILQEDMLTQLAGGASMDLEWDLLLQVEQLLSWSVGLRQLRKGDSLTLIGRTIAPVDGHQSRRMLDALKVTSSAADRTFYAFRREGTPTWVDRQGVPLRRRFLSSPVSYGSVSSRYNLSRLHPVLRTIRPHKGTDFAAPPETPIRAVGDGEITRMEFRNNNGNYVEITHDESFRTMYLHMSEFPTGQQIGDMVKQGTIIGYVGSTGLSTGPHVCLRFWVGETQEDFLSVIRNYPSPDRIPREEMDLFVPLRDSLLQEIEVVERAAMED